MSKLIDPVQQGFLIDVAIAADINSYPEVRTFLSTLARPMAAATQDQIERFDILFDKYEDPRWLSAIDVGA